MTAFFRRVTRIAEARHYPLEFALLGFSMLALAYAIVQVVRVATSDGPESGDLTFAGTISELTEALRANGSERFGVIDNATLVVGFDTVRVDTLIVKADSTQEPSVARGGFLADQFAAFNDYAIRQAVISRMSGANGRPAAADGPSLFRAVWTEDGKRQLSGYPNQFAMTVRSPYAERTWREVRTVDWKRASGLLGLQGDLELTADLPDPLRARLNGHECLVRNAAPRFLLYCTSESAAEVSKFFDVGLEVVPSSSGGRFARVFGDRPLNLWRNGQDAKLQTVSAKAGDLLDLQSMGPFLLSVADRGTLAAGQWVNGRTGFANQNLGTMSFFSTAGRTTSLAKENSPMILALDHTLSSDLEVESRRFANNHAGLLPRMAHVILDISSGEVKAIVETGRENTDALLSFEPLLVGSVVKPMVASAILSMQPALGDLRIEYGGSPIGHVDGVRLSKAFENSANGCEGTIDFRAFLRCSSNQYAAELIMRSLRTDGYAWDGNGDSMIPKEILEHSTLASGMAIAFDTDVFGYRTAGRNPYSWNARCTPGSGAASDNRTFLPWESRPWILFPDSSGTRTDLISRYAFGGWENRWTLVGVAEAYARIATGREMRASFLHCAPSGNATSRFLQSEPRTLTAFSMVREGLMQVGQNGTAAGLSTRLKGATDERATVLVKTGTLNEMTDRFKALAIVVGMPGPAGAGSSLACGLVVVSYYEFNRSSVRDEERGSLPPVHLDFARGPLASVLGRHWTQVSGCPAPPAAAGGGPS